MSAEIFQVVVLDIERLVPGLCVPLSNRTQGSAIAPQVWPSRRGAERNPTLVPCTSFACLTQPNPSTPSHTQSPEAGHNRPSRTQSLQATLNCVTLRPTAPSHSQTAPSRTQQHKATHPTHVQSPSRGGGPAGAGRCANMPPTSPPAAAMPPSAGPAPPIMGGGGGAAGGPPMPPTVPPPPPTASAMDRGVLHLLHSVRLAKLLLPHLCIGLAVKVEGSVRCLLRETGQGLGSRDWGSGGAQRLPHTSQTARCSNCDLQQRTCYYTLVKQICRLADKLQAHGARAA